MNTKILQALFVCLWALWSTATAQSIINGSFEYNSANSARRWTDQYPAGDITQAGGMSQGYTYLTGWDIYRPDTWTDSGGSGIPQYVTLIQDTTTDWSDYINTTPTFGGSNPGPKPTAAVDGSAYLSIYNDFAPSTLVTQTTLSTTITGLQVGQTYQLTYSYAGVGETNAGHNQVGLNVNLGGTLLDSHQIMDFTDAPIASGPGTGLWMTDNGASNSAVYSNWQQAQVQFTASRTSMDLSFIGILQGGPAQLSLDNVAVTPVPEPSAALLFVVFVPLERIFALRPQQIFRRQFWADVGFFFMNRAIDTFAMALPFGVLAFALSKLPLHGLHARVASWPLAWKLICALLIGEVAAYWAHRLMHRIPLLWRFHAIHHSAEEMDWLVNVRVHPVEFVFMRLFQFVPLYVLGFIQPGRKDAGLLMMALPIVAALWGYLIHANIKLRFGFIE